MQRTYTHDQAHRYFYQENQIKLNHIGDLDALPKIIQNISKVLPFQYISDVPVRIYVGNISLTDEDSFVRSEAIKNINSLVNLIDISIKDDDLIVAKNALNLILSLAERDEEELIDDSKIIPDYVKEYQED